MSGDRRLLRQAMEALEPFALEADCWEHYDDGEPLVEGFHSYEGKVVVYDLRLARAIHTAIVVALKEGT